MRGLELVALDDIHKEAIVVQHLEHRLVVDRDVQRHDRVLLAVEVPVEP